jgi:hypothetical protein
MEIFNLSKPKVAKVMNYTGRTIFINVCDYNGLTIFLSKSAVESNHIDAKRLSPRSPHRFVSIPIRSD